MLLVVHGQVVAKQAAGPEATAGGDALKERIDNARKVVASGKNDLKELMALGKALYLGGAQRPDEPWLQESYDVWGELLTRYPKEPLVQAYAGSVRVLQARDAFFPWTKGKLLKQGQRLLTEARSQSPGDMQVIWLQAVTAYHLPEKFGQRETAIKNFTTLAQALTLFEAQRKQAASNDNDNQAQAKQPSDSAEAFRTAENEQGVVMINNLEPAMEASVWYYHGLTLQNDADLNGAIEAWQRSVKADPQSSAGKAASARIKKHAAK